MRPTAVVMVTLMLGVAGVAACGSDRNDGGDVAAFTRLDPDQFEARMDHAAAPVINVHVPYEGEIEGTDAFIPFDRVVEDPALPGDRESEILLYCRSGRMSAEAAEALIEAGYTNVSHLEGGFIAWEAAGKRLVHRSSGDDPAPRPLAGE